MKQIQPVQGSLLGWSKASTHRRHAVLVLVVWAATQTACMTTDLQKSVRSHMDVKDGVEILASLSEVESITQTKTGVLPYAPVLYPFASMSKRASMTPWFKTYQIAFKSSETRFEPDGSLREVEERQGWLNLDFGWSGLPLFLSKFLHHHRLEIFDVFKRYSEQDFTAGEMTDGRMSDQLKELLAELRDFSEAEFNVASRLFQAEQIDFRYHITTRLPDGSVQKEYYNEYVVIDESIPIRSHRVTTFPTPFVKAVSLLNE